MKTSGLILILTCAASLGVPMAEAQTKDTARCYELEVAEPGALFMLERNVDGDTLILTDEPLHDSPGATKGSRAYLGSAHWTEKAPLRPRSWYWKRTEPSQIRVALVMPLWDIVWTAEETPLGLEGEVSYHSDEVGEAVRTSPFIGRRIACDGGAAATSPDADEHR
jgi:hypothetical protein